MFGADDMFDGDYDGDRDFWEESEEQDDYDRMEKRGLYEEEEEDDGDLLDAELKLAGLNRDELEMMDDDKRAEALEEAGIDPDDWEY